MTKDKETKKAFKDGTITGIRTEHYVKSNSKDNDDELSEDKPKLSKIESKTVAGAGFNAAMPETEGSKDKKKKSKKTKT